MSQKQLSSRIRGKAQLQYAELIGRLYACERLEDEFESIKDHRVLYGWNLLAQEVLIRLSEASLKLLHMIHSDNDPPGVTAWLLCGGNSPWKSGGCPG